MLLECCSNRSECCCIIGSIYDTRDTLYPNDALSGDTKEHKEALQ